MERVPITSYSAMLMPNTEPVDLCRAARKYINSDVNKTRLFYLINKQNKNLIAWIFVLINNEIIKVLEKFKLTSEKIKLNETTAYVKKWQLLEKASIRNKISMDISKESIVNPYKTHRYSFADEDKIKPTKIVRTVKSRPKTPLIINPEDYATGKYGVIKKEHITLIPKTVSINLTDLFKQGKTNLFHFIYKNKDGIIADIIYINLKTMEEEMVGRYKFIPKKIKHEAYTFIGSWKKIYSLKIKNYNSSRLLYSRIYRHLKKEIKNYYSILGVKIDVSQDEIKKAYHQLANKFHPDKGIAVDEGVFKLIAEAYEILGDVKKRAAYDKAMKNLVKQNTLKNLAAYFENPENRGKIFYYNKDTNRRIILVADEVIAAATGVELAVVPWAILALNQKERNEMEYYVQFYTKSKRQIETNNENKPEI